MPAPGEQHLNTGGKAITNPFEDVKPRISEYTAQEIATLQSRLEKQLGPEYISSRAGPSGQKVHYLAAEKCIQLANEVFGFNGWSSQIMDVQVDFVDENPQTFKVSLGLSVIVRVTLRDGTFHEDVGYGHMENCKGKAAAFEKAKKEGTTDALKRALRNFGNVLGNCIYDKEYLKQVTKIKAQPTKWDVEKLHRHSTFMPPIKRESEPEFKPLEEKSQNGVAGTSLSTEDTFDDEFGDFDEADFSVADPESHPDEVVIAPEPPAASHHFNGGRGRQPPPNGGTPVVNRPPANRPQPVSGPGRGQSVGNSNQAVQPQTPNSGFTRSNSGAGQAMRPPADTGLQARPVIGGRVLNQPSRNGPPSAPVSPVRPNRSSDDADPGMPPQGAGFFSARAAAMLPEGQTAEGAPAPIPNHLPAFNPHAESPSIRKTAGIDHKTSKPLTRDLKHVPASSQAVAASPGPKTTNVVNPQLDAARRIGAPGGFSPMANRGSFKQPLKRPVDVGGNRTPLTDLPANGTIGGDAGDVKRQRINE
ncbi:recombination protein Rad52 [Hyaloscypha variabilis F]|uniref:RAD52 homolog n=1 Tax=Hyaloscypha variabilis (strain UAMH 11265 / GT02V1 / F) TaxID=1149755 RepID=A0A2J6RZL2_HYAVF|nr:recombination protein Rad52 [Hyaloscypha variabilis F]